MAISRAQLVKELEPGLNALFGLEYDQYGREYEDIFNMENSDRAFEEEVMLSGFGSAPTKTEGTAITYDDAQEVYTARILWRLSHLRSPSPKRQSKIIFMIDWLVGTHGLWQEA